jgi:choline-glycine betaine transporter
MNHDNSQGMGKHMLLMLVCCLVPLALILAVSVFGLSLGALQPLVPFALALMCPLMMIFMMRGMGHDHGSADAHQHHTHAQESKPSPSTQLTETKTSAEQKSCH